jgi:hypothetical protein
MSIRRETVYWHGCADGACDSDSHGCARVELWVQGSGGGQLGHIYEGGIHCAACAERWQETADAPLSGLLFSGDEWWDTTMPGCQRLECSTCSALLDESHDEQSCGCANGALVMIGDGPPMPLAMSA